MATRFRKLREPPAKQRICNILVMYKCSTNLFSHVEERGEDQGAVGGDGGDPVALQVQLLQALQPREVHHLLHLCVCV